MLAPYIEGHESSALRVLGRRSLDLYDDFLARVSADSGRPIAYARSGTLEVAFDAEELARLRASAAALAEIGVEARLLTGDGVHDLEPSVSIDATGALAIETHGFVSVPDLTEALAAAAARAGAEFRLGVSATAIRRHHGELAIETTDGVMSADRVVLAAGSWSGEIPIEALDPAPVKPIRGQLLHLIWPGQPVLRRVLWSSECYIVPWPNGRVLVGATVEDAGFDERATAAGVRDLLEAACTLVPQLWQASFVEARVGLRPASPDGLPMIGRAAAVPQVIYATGHYRNGILLAPLTAQLVADLVLGREDDDALRTLAPARVGRI